MPTPARLQCRNARSVLLLEETSRAPAARNESYLRAWISVNYHPSGSCSFASGNRDDRDEATAATNAIDILERRRSSYQFSSSPPDRVAGISTKSSSWRHDALPRSSASSLGCFLHLDEFQETGYLVERLYRRLTRCHGTQVSMHTSTALDRAIHDPSETQEIGRASSSCAGWDQLFIKQASVLNRVCATLGSATLRHHDTGTL